MHTDQYIPNGELVRCQIFYAHETSLTLADS